VVDKTRQELRAVQGSRVVLRTPVSTGARGHNTPVGSFTAQGKERMHYSRLYDNSPMPYSVHLRGHIFVHGYTSVPRYPASHGCVRVPLRGGNPARWFYRWVEIGTPVSIEGNWTGSRRRTVRRGSPRRSSQIRRQR
jgi:lipoprotein-anchoring transpeptidase ErfK/SrfK